MERIISLILRYRLTDIPIEIQQKAKYVLLDCIGEIQSAKPYSKLSQERNDEHSMIKAFVSGIKLVENELDEGNSLAKGHPACHFVPAYLQLAKSKAFSNEQLLEALIVGYEVGARIGEITVLKKEIHPHANWGLLGGAAALAKLYQWNREQTRQALNIAAQFAAPTLWGSVLEGHEMRNVLIGMNNLQLLLLPMLIESQYSASDETLALVFSTILGDSFLIDRFEEDPNCYYLEHTYFKFYDSCRFCHGSIDALQKLLEKMEISSVTDIEEIDIYTYQSAAELCNQTPRNEFAGKFSIPFAVAKEAYRCTEEPYNISNLYALAARVKVQADAEITAKAPAVRATRMVMNTKQHKSEVYIETATGDRHTVDLEQRVWRKLYHNVKHLYTEQELRKITEAFLKDNIFPVELL